MIRPAQPGDAHGIADVHVRTWRGAYGHVFPRQELDALSVDEREQRWRSWLAGDGADMLVAERDGRVIGFAGVGPSRDEDGLGELYAIYVLPEAWGTGAGPELMAAALDALRATGYAEATLWVLEDNPRGRHFYEKTGWALDGTTRRGVHLGTEVAEVRYRISL